jgi:nitrite reductase/ring-hydroxylating ferredoxin subunit
MGLLRDVARAAELPPGSARCVEIDGRKIAVFNVSGHLYAIDDTCTHRGGPLSEGDVEGHVVTCPWHGGQFDLETGSVRRPPPARPVATYRVVLEGDQVKVEV